MSKLETPIQVVKTEDGFELYDLNDFYLVISDNQEVADFILDRVNRHEYLFMENETLKKRIEELEKDKARLDALEEEVCKENDELKLRIKELQSENKSLSDCMIRLCEICHGLIIKNNDNSQQPEPFWKPIEQCPKEEGKIYDLWGRDDNEYIRISDCIFDEVFRQKLTRIAVASLPITFTNPNFKPTHFAEIPPCEEQS